MRAPSAPSHTTTFQSACSPIFCSRGGAVIREKSLNCCTETTISTAPSAVSSMVKGSSRQGDSASSRWSMRSSPRSRAARTPSIPPSSSDAGGVEGDADRGGTSSVTLRFLFAVGVEDGHRVAGEGFAIEVEGARRSCSLSVSSSTE